MRNIPPEDDKSTAAPQGKAKERTDPPIVASIRYALRELIKSGKHRVEAGWQVISSLPRLAETHDVASHLGEIEQAILEQGITQDEIVRICEAVAEGVKPFIPDSPANDEQAKALVALVYDPSALFFLTVIKPSEDGRALTWSVPFTSAEAPTVIDNQVVGGLAEMLAMARKEAKLGNNVYLTTNSFVQPFYAKDGKQKGFRKTQNLSGSRTLTADLDVGKTDAYATREEGLKDVARVLRESGLPEPTLIVNSGRGVHLWWVLDRTLTAAEWRRVARIFSRLLQHHRLKFDSQCTANPTGVLRLCGTCNFKEGKERAVTLDHSGGVCSADVILGILGAFDGSGAAWAKSMPGAEPIPHRPSPLSAQARERYRNFVEGDSAPRVDLDIVRRGCPATDNALNTGGKGYREPRWWNDLKLAYFSSDPIGNAERLSCGHADFTPEKTEKKLATIAEQHAAEDFGWPPCATFIGLGKDAPPECKTCPHRDEGKSPLNFGLETVAPAAGLPSTAEAVPPEAQDWLARAMRQHGVIPAGRYRGALLRRDIQSFETKTNETKKMSGVSFVIGITDGPYEGYECPLSLATAGTVEAVIGRDLAILANWAQALDIGPTENPIELIKALGRAGKNRSMTFDIGVDTWNGRRKLVLRGVSVDG